MGCLLGPIFGIIKTILAFIGFITLIVALIVGVGVWQLTQPSAMEGKMHPVVYTVADAISFDEKINELADWLTDAPAGSQAQLELTEAEVSAKIAAEIEGSDMPVDISDVYVNFGSVLVLAKVTAGGMTFSAGLELDIKVVNGEARIEIIEISIGRGFGVPGFLKEQLASVIPTEEALTKMLRDLPIEINAVETDPETGRLIFTVTKR